MLGSRLDFSPLLFLLSAAPSRGETDTEREGDRIMHADWLTKETHDTV